MLELRDGGRRVGGRWLWRGLSFTLAAGERLGVVGPSGSGKTLLLRVLAALDRLDEGEVRFDGRSPDDREIPAFRASVVYLAQAPALVEGTVEHNLRLPFGFRVHEGEEYRREVALALLRELGRDEGFLERDGDDLSGGERQLVAFLRAHLLAPRVLLLDEPTANLDADATATLETLYRRWLGEADDRAAIWTSHDGDQIARVADRTLELHRQPEEAGGSQPERPGGGPGPSGDASMPAGAGEAP